MMVFAGLFVTPSNVPNFMIWLYWISPFSWAVRALALIEFTSARYDEIVANSSGANQRVGDIYLQTIDMKTDPAWIGYAILYLVCITLVVVFLNSWFLKSRYYEESIGTRRTDEQELVESDEVGQLQNDNQNNVDNDDELMKEQALAAAVQQAHIQEQSMNASKTGITSTHLTSSLNGQQSATGTSASGSSNMLQTLRENLPFAPAWLSFSNITYTVKVKKDKQTVDRVLLNNVYGYAQPGKMLALMGASGVCFCSIVDFD
jgi:hypothetical protein